MDNNYLKEIVKIASQIPAEALNTIVQYLESYGSRSEAKRILWQEFGANNKVQQLLNALDSEEQLNASEIALVLRTMQLSNQNQEGQNVSLVWSGPDVLCIPMRKTEQVVLEMIDGAETTLFISSFAVYKIQNILKHLEQAINRGVEVTMLLETPQSSHYKIRSDPLLLFPEILRDKIKFFIWPYKNRIKANEDITGSLHAKFLIQDRKAVFISSANLTESAFDRNIELGVMIENKKIAQRLDEQIQNLILEDTIIRI